MQAIVTSGQRMCQHVRAKVAPNRLAPTRSQTAETSAARKMLVPVAISTFKSKKAFSTSRRSTTGGCRATRWCSPGVSTLTTVGFSRFLNAGKPQTNTNTVSSTHGTHADAIWERVYVMAWVLTASSSGKRQTSRG